MSRTSPRPADAPPPATPPARAGAATTPVAGQRARALAAWDAFAAVAADPRLDLDAPSRCRGWTGRDVIVHLASWPEAPLLARRLAEARGDAEPRTVPLDQDAANARVVAAHRDAGRNTLVAALADGRRRLAGAYAEAGTLGLAPTASQVGPVPLLTQLGAIAYELAVHALDLAPCGAAEPAPELLDAGVLALADITGALAARHGLRARAALVTADGGWAFEADGAAGWTVTAVAADGGRGPGVAASSAAVLLDASAGRRGVPALLAQRELRLRQAPALLALAPLLERVPGLPGGPALRVAAGMLGGVGRFAGLLGRR